LFCDSLIEGANLKEVAMQSQQNVDDRMLDLFINQKYHWKSLSPEQQRLMAVELQKHRFLERKYLEFIGEVLADMDAARRYRELLNVDD
jgi:hypothetical protein